MSTAAAGDWARLCPVCARVLRGGAHDAGCTIGGALHDAWSAGWVAGLRDSDAREMTRNPYAIPRRPVTRA